MAERQRTLVIRQFITEMVRQHPGEVAALTAQRFKITRQAVSRHIDWLVKHGVLRKSGNTVARTYDLVVHGCLHRQYSTRDLKEDIVWRDDVKPLLNGAAENVATISNIAFTEMLNNVIDHSESEFVTVDVLATAATISMKIRDFGVGIFRKIAQACHLQDERDAILELGKGRLTTAPKAHSGYGVFFTSRMVDVFTMASGKLLFTHIQPDDDWLMELEQDFIDGTSVDLVISMTTERTANGVYDRFCSSVDSDLGFSRTHVPIALAQYGSEQLVSRSQAKRVLSRFEKFSEVLLDFRGIDFIGQSFADEIFRVFATAHPEVKIGHINAGPQVLGMIRLAQDLANDRQRTLFEN